MNIEEYTERVLLMLSTWQSERKRRQMNQHLPMTNSDVTLTFVVSEEIRDRLVKKFADVIDFQTKNKPKEARIVSRAIINTLREAIEDGHFIKSIKT